MNNTPLGYGIDAPLAIPASCFSDKGIAVLLVTGGSYGGQWVLNALPMNMDGTVSDQPCGTITTAEAPRDPERALTAARAWFEAHCEGTPFALIDLKSLNHMYGPNEAPFMASGQAIVAIPVGNE
jgi:hypothetical protein